MNDNIVVMLNEEQYFQLKTLCQRFYYIPLISMVDGVQKETDGGYVGDIAYSIYCSTLKFLIAKKPDSPLIKRLLDLGELQQIDFEKCLNSYSVPSEYAFA